MRPDGIATSRYILSMDIVLVQAVECIWPHEVLIAEPTEFEQVQFHPKVAKPQCCAVINKVARTQQS